ncbi:hypothetical protein DV515_00004603 [Chloebia gouldiae]|uniref:Uncharacterized protein n=1 Tax=Chloebia gouldiae TaxID=44316 RepID=A0A3L8ST43_CHLGU|nr:hypothetical protein DV515_00004603 [Chloebia gouldiae]
MIQSTSTQYAEDQGNMLYAGTEIHIVACDEFMHRAVEDISEDVTDRCNNVLYIRGVEEEEEDGEMRE